MLDVPILFSPIPLGYFLEIGFHGVVTVIFTEGRKVKKKSWKERRKEVKSEEKQEGRKEKRRREIKNRFQTKAYTKLMVQLFRKPGILN